MLQRIHKFPSRGRKTVRSMSKIYLENVECFKMLYFRNKIST